MVAHKHDVLHDLEMRLQYQFAQRGLLLQALTHRSYGVPHYERLEFLGDSVLNLVVSELLIHSKPVLEEGVMSRVRSALVNHDMLYSLAISMNLKDYLRLGVGELKGGGAQRPSILADSMEAIMGAIYLDGGWLSACAVIRRWLAPEFIKIGSLEQLPKDSKSRLQEWMQGRHLPLPLYEVTVTEGAEHERIFTVSCILDSLKLMSTGTGKTRRLAEQQAALILLSQLEGSD